MMTMSAFQGQDDYINSLKQIKEIEDKVQSEIELYRKKVEDEIKKLQEDLKTSIALSHRNGEELVQKSINSARDTSTKEAEKIISDAEKKSKSINFQSDKRTMKEIMDILFSDI